MIFDLVIEFQLIDIPAGLLGEVGGEEVEPVVVVEVGTLKNIGSSEACGLHEEDSSWSHDLPSWSHDLPSCSFFTTNASSTIYNRPKRLITILSHEVSTTHLLYCVISQIA